ncbi:hypothetical protein HPB52_011518 [Rhipicephalus sanguineus]|uniref:Uncharacterized protein n=2 Tax=Rhipicephalus sanguineus TaxID=34632 RepID=A0A9D4T9J9_RHISA|nr:hypothetical protein HPB52_011518 [Rhipicephalus sanguineus]
METLRIGILLMDEEVNRLVLGRIAELGLGERVDCVYAVKSDWRLVRCREAYGMTCFRKVRVLYSPALDGDHSLNIVHRVQETLTSLYLEGMAGVYMSCTAAQCLADVFAKSNALEHVTLLLDVEAGIVVTVLEGLALSRTIYSVVVGHRWQLCGKVAIAFGETLQKNSSIAELTVWQDTRIGFEELKAQLRLGVKRNYAIYKVQLLYGPEKNESHDWALLQMLHNNRIAINWAADVILGNSCTGACMYAFIRMKACNNCWAVLRHATGCDKQELESKMAEACKRSERELPRVPPGVTRAGGQIEVSGKRTSELYTLDNDFIEQVKIFFEAKKRENKPRRAQ